MTPKPRLNEMLSHVLVALTRAYEARERTAPSLALHAVLLRVLDSKGVDVRELPTRACVSKRVVTAAVKGAAREGFVTMSDKTARLTVAGGRARGLAETTLAAAEAQWTKQQSPALRTALAGLVARFELEHPHYFAPYGPADLSAIGGKYPGHGTDWRPVPRVEPAGVAALPLTSLVAQALTNFTIRYEAGPTWALAWTVHALRRFPDGGVAFADAPRGAHLTGDGRSTLERHGAVRVGEDRVARLTAGGKACRDAYEPNVARVEAEWRDTYGDSRVTAVRKALTAVDSKLPPGLVDFPVISMIGGVREVSG